MSERYVEINSEEFEKFLASTGAERTVQNTEIVYVRTHDKNTNLKLKIYTSIRIGENVARDCGKDAIRVCGIFDNGQRSFGIAKLPRVYRTGSQEAVHQRVLERMREAYRLLNEWNKKNK